MMKKAVLLRYAIFFFVMARLTIGNDPSYAGVSSAENHKESIDVIVGMPPGGSIDGYARLLERHLPRFLPGTPSIVVKNKPGAGSLLAVTTVANSTPSDGLLMATFSSALIVDAITDPARFRIDLRHFRFIGNIGEDYRVCYVRSDAEISTMQDLAAKGHVAFGSSALGSSGMLNLGILQSLFDVTLRQIRGYPGSAAKRLAIDRGEIDGDCGSIDLIPEEWIEQHKVKILFRFLPAPPPGPEQNIPFLGNLLKNDADRKVYDFLIMPSRLVGTFMVSDKISMDKVDELRRGFDAMVKDGSFLEDAKNARLSVVAISGADLDREIADFYETPPEVLQRAKAILAK